MSNGIIKNMGYHLVDSTAMLASSSPFLCASETMIAGMSDDVSINTRLYVASLMYLGLGRLISKGRNFSRKIFNITDITEEKIQTLHDSLYLTLIAIPLSVGFYTAAGETSIRKIAIGAAVSAAYNLILAL